MKNLFPLDFAKYLSYSEVQRTAKLLMFKALSEQVFGK